MVGNKDIEQYSYRCLVFRTAGLKRVLKKAQVKNSLSFVKRRSLHKKIIGLIKEVESDGS
jgi:hypothetical protein